MIARVFPYDPSSRGRSRAVRACLAGSALVCLSLAYATNSALFALLALLVPIGVHRFLASPVVEGVKDPRAHWFEFRTDMIVFGDNRRHSELLLGPSSEVKIAATGEAHVVIDWAQRYLFPRYYRDASGATYELVAADGRVRLAPRSTVPDVHTLRLRIDL